ncbi:MAG TPA: hypothetical protein PKY82_02890 [Pyrinomonadaceae bacterium]|nr:hypothetical protein [Pyrinomonadaceae bacterium]
MKILLLLMLMMFASCEAQSKLPKEMPSDVEMNFNENGGMTQFFTSIRIKGESLNYKARLPQTGQKEITWTAKISAADKANLYQLFVENKFDTIKNEPNKGIVYDAGSEGVNISFGKESFQVSSGANSPLSAQNQKRYSAVAGEFEKLAKKYESMQEKTVETSLEETRKNAADFFTKIYQPVPEKTMFQMRFSPFFPTEWTDRKLTNWISYVYASGTEISLNDGERVARIFGKITFNPTSNKAIFEKISDKIEGGEIQGVKALPKQFVDILSNQKNIENILLKTKSRSDLSVQDAEKVSNFYKYWMRYNGVIYKEIAPNHSAFDLWFSNQTEK